MSGKKYLIGMVVMASLANGYWASLTQVGNGRPEGTSVLMSMLAVWACYFAFTWLFEGMKPSKAMPIRRAVRPR